MIAIGQAAPCCDSACVLELQQPARGQGSEVRLATKLQNKQTDSFLHTTVSAVPLGTQTIPAHCPRAVSLTSFIIRGDMRAYYRQRQEAGHRAGREFLERNKGAGRAWLGGFLDVSIAVSICSSGQVTACMSLDHAVWWCAPNLAAARCGGLIVYSLWSRTAHYQAGCSRVIDARVTHQADYNVDACGLMATTVRARSWRSPLW